MQYVALLRAVNVGGTGTVNMRALKGVVEAAGMTRVRTYINSGNVLFASTSRSAPRLARTLETAITKHVGFPISLIVLTHAALRAIVAALPATWANDDEAKCDVFFLWPSIDRPAVLEQLPYDPAVDDVRYVPGALLRRVKRADAARSKLTRIVGTPLHRMMTVRNCTTARTLLALLDNENASTQ